MPCATEDTELPVKLSIVATQWQLAAKNKGFATLKNKLNQACECWTQGMRKYEALLARTFRASSGYHDRYTNHNKKAVCPK